jgi:hypothetical protein
MPGNEASQTSASMRCFSRLWRICMTSREGRATAIPLIAGLNRIVAVQECDATEI